MVWVKKMSFDKFKKEYIPLVKNFDCGNVVINNFLDSENALDFNQGITYVLLSDDKDFIIQIVFQASMKGTILIENVLKRLIDIQSNSIIENLLIYICQYLYLKKDILKKK